MIFIVSVIVVSVIMNECKTIILFTFFFMFRSAVYNAKGYVQTRAYSDILRNLPRVGGAVSKFGKPEDKPKVNRFAQQYSGERRPGNGERGQGRGERGQGNGDRGQERGEKRVSGEKKVNGEKKREKKVNATKQNSSDGINDSRTTEAVNQVRSYEEIRKVMREKVMKEKPKVASKTTGTKKVSAPAVSRGEPIKISLPPYITVSNLANTMNVSLNDMLKKLRELGFENMRHSYILDKENAALIADEYNFEVKFSENAMEDLFPAVTNTKMLKERPPVVTIMGHVDHGKTTILDYLRKSSVVDEEFGGITQHIGAFSVVTPVSKKKITFLDTPGHAAFLKMRERGAIITDIVILVVAADDSVMPQTIEAIKHAKKSGVPMIVAINKCDKPGVKLDKVLSDLAAHDVDIEDYGGETQTVRVSGKTGMNMDKLEEAVITLSEMSEFKAEATGIHADGWVIESQVVKGVGNIATVLVRRGSVKSGDVLVAGHTYCKVRGMKDEHGKVVKLAGPLTPVQVWGWKELPESGDQIVQAKSELVAKRVVANRITRAKEIQSSRDIESINQKRREEIEQQERQEKINALKMAGLDLSVLEEEDADGTECKKVHYMVKADVFGSAEAIKESIHGMGNDEVQSLVVSHGAGAPTESDVELAKTLEATIFCFNVKVPKAIMSKADREGVSIKEHNIIYRLIEDVTGQLTAQLKPIIEVKTLGEVEIKDTFVITVRKSKVKIAGCKVSSGAIKKTSNVRVLRGDAEVYKGTLSSLKHVKDDIAESRKGQECGIAFDKWDKFEKGDIIQVYEEVEKERYL